METKIYKIMEWVKSYETINKIHFLLSGGFYRNVHVDFLENERTAC